MTAEQVAEEHPRSGSGTIPGRRDGGFVGVADPAIFAMARQSRRV